MGFYFGSHRQSIDDAVEKFLILRCFQGTLGVVGFKMVPSFAFLCAVLVVLQTSMRCQAFTALPHLRAIRKTKSLSALSMSSTPLSDMLGLMPICLAATSKTTTTNDPTAGMSPEEIVNYISNVGGGMCGYPDWARTAIGVGLNLSLIAFGLCTVSYGAYSLLIVLSGSIMLYSIDADLDVDIDLILAVT